MAVLLSAPGITLRKWQTKEIGKTLPYAKTSIIRTADEALQMLNKIRNGYRPAPGEMEITIVGIDKAKRDAEPYYAGVWKRVNGQKNYCWHCPDCGRQLMKKVEGEWFPLEWSDVAFGEQPSIERLSDARVEMKLNPNGLPNDYNVKWKHTKQFMKCSYTLKPKGCTETEDEVCGTKLFRPATKSRGETRNKPTTNISRIFKKMNKYFDLYICDEAHQCKAGGSGRADAYDKMVKSAKRNLNLTGTLVNGKASSIKELLWRTTPQDLIDKGFNDASGDIAWAEKYGKLKQVVYLQDEVSTEGWVTRQRRKPMQPTEEPGIAPQMTAQFLLHKTAFLDIDDLGLPLVELVEKPVFIQPKPEHEVAYREFHEAMYDKCSRIARAGGKGAWSKFNPAVLNYAARPDLGAFYSFMSSDGHEEIITAPKLEGYTAKEEWLINQVKAELAEDRGVVIYNNYTGEYQLNERTQQILKENGIESKLPNSFKFSPLKIGWVSGNESIIQQLDNYKDLTIVSPTGLSINNQFNLQVNSSPSTENKIQAQGKFIWARLIIQNDTKSNVHTFLSNPSKTQGVIKDIYQTAIANHWYGINLDIENVSTNDRDLFSNFVKNLSNTLNKTSITLSIDLPPDSGNNNKHSAFDHELLGKYCNYIIFMGYDQHWSTDPVPGPVTSLSWLKENIEEYIQTGIPPEKIILGLPAFTRIWQQDQEGHIVKDPAEPIQYVENLVQQNKRNLTWDSTLGEYYTSYMVNNLQYKIWLPSEKSIDIYLGLISQFHLGGSAIWNLNLISSDYWNKLF